MRLLVVRLGSLGDLVHTLPAVAAIRRARSDAQIDWLVDAVHREFLDLVPVIDRVVALGERSARGWLAARRDLRERHYDVALDFQGLLKSAALARLSGSARVLGFDGEALRERAAAPFYTERVEVGERGHVVFKNLRLAAAVGAEAERLEFPIAVIDSPAATAIASQGHARIALVNPAAAWPNKRWPSDRLGAVASHIRSRHGLTPVVLWGPGERELAEAVVAASRGAAIVAPQTSLRDLVALSRMAGLIVSGDTGPTHIAAAVGVPVVALFGPTDAGRNGPWRDEDVSLSRYGACECHYQRRCRLDAGRWCLATISVDDVIEAVDRRMAAAAAGRRP